MKKFIITLIAVLAICPFASAQKYQGSAALGASVIGATVNTSHGVRFEKDYIGLGAEAGFWSLILINREWTAVYADYQRYFPFSPKWSFFLQGSPGICRTEYSVIGDNSESTESEPEIGFKGYAKLGLGLDWQWNKCGMSLSLQNNLFTSTHDSEKTAVHWIPFLQLSFHW